MVEIYVNGTRIRLDPSQSIGKGGEADVFDIGSGKVAKVFKAPNHPDYQGAPDEQKGARERIATHQEKLPAFPRNLPGRVVVPIELATDQSRNKIVGYTMPFLKGMEMLLRYTDKGFREKGIPPNVVPAIFKDLHATVRGIHEKGVVIGDFNDLNVLVRGAEAHIIDADSFQFGNFLCTMFTGRFVDPVLCDSRLNHLELQRPHTAMSDWYAFAVMLMQCLLFVDPYGGIYLPQDTAKRIRHDARPLTRITVFHPNVRYPKPAIPYGYLPDDVLQQFHLMFEKDERGEFPLHLLDAIQWKTCSTCGTEHARSVCPQCKHAAPGAIKAVVEVRGKVTATRIFHTHGVILYATSQNCSFRWLYHENNAFKREDSSVVISGNLDPQFRFRIRGNETLIGKDGEMVTLGSAPLSDRMAVGSYGLLPVFDTNADNRYWVDYNALMRDGTFAPERIGDILPGQTLFWVGPRFGFGFYRAGTLHISFVFDAQRKGINDTVQMSGIPGQLIDASCIFSDSVGWFFAAFQTGGATLYRVTAFDATGTILGTHEARASESPWLASVRGSTAVGALLFVPTDEGIVRVEASHGTVVVTKTFPDTEPFVDAESKLIAFSRGLAVVTKHEITELKIS